jgi:phosphatidylserine/phosphatidylglycerophosphate/cardiolipin synthase-like enzyme
VLCVRASVFLGISAVVACRGGDVRQGAREPRPASGGEDVAIELVESAPLETTLDHADVRNASDVWPEMIDKATDSIDFAEFYASEADDKHLEGSKLTPVIVAIERAAARGVRVRFMADLVFVKTYPETLERLRNAKVDVKVVDYSKIGGGIIHAKYFVVDGQDVFIGSQNFDWRALAHIQEMGVRIHSLSVAHAASEIFAIDWEGKKTSAPQHSPSIATTGERIVLVASPTGWLPDEKEWELPRIVAAIDGAKKAIDVQVLTIAPHNRDKTAFTTLDDALRRAASRGVKIRLLVSSWAKAPDLAGIAAVPNVEVKVITIPPWSGGEIPFARVSHAKYAVFDGGALAWVGTSNWEGDYFTKSRNLGVMIEGGKAPARLEGIFEDGWKSPYTKSFAAP